MDGQFEEEGLSGITSEQPLESLSIEELEEVQKENIETISRLKADIELVKWKLSQFGVDAYLGPEYDPISRQGVPDADSVEAVKRNLQKETENYANRLNETMRLTGVSLDTVDRRVELLDDNRCMKEFNMNITVCSRKVCLTCTVEEQFSPAENAPLMGKVTWFRIQFQEDIHRAIGEDIHKAAENIALHSAFSLLKSYLEWKKERDEIVVPLVESNPDQVKLYTSEDGMYCLNITNPKPDRAVFTVEWGKKTVGERIVPDVQLKVDAPQKWKAMDTRNVLGSAPEIFETMITTLGLEKALKVFVQLVATDGQVPQTLLPLVQSSD